MKIGKKVFKYVLYFLLIPVIYIVVSLVLSSIAINRYEPNETSDQSIYLASNGVHLDIIIPKENLDSILLSTVIHQSSENYFAFGWGDEEFYLNTSKWEDLTIKIALSAVFLKSPTLVHVSRYKTVRSDWMEIKITEPELKKLNKYIYETFALNEKGETVVLKNRGYGSRDDFYKAKGSFSLFKTCNTWVNAGFKMSGLKSCLWTPFDFGLMNKYR